MTTDLSPQGDQRCALIHAPRGRDSAVVDQVLAAQGLAARVCSSIDELLGALERGAGLAFVTEESLAGDDALRLSAWVTAQPPWSDFPFVVLASRRVGRRASGAAEALAQLGNVMLLERPLNAETLVSSARSALRGRERQYQAREHLLAEEASRRSEQAAYAQLEIEREALLRAERTARQESESAGRMKDEFLATLSHELRTPLSAILGWTHLLAQPNIQPEAVAKAASVVERNARAQAQLIEDLLDISRISAGTVRLEVATTPVGPLIDAVTQMLRPAADAKNLRITARVAADARDAWADPARLQQIVWNLVSNAIKFTPRGGEVVLAAANEGESRVTVRVSDTGAGIAPDFLPHVFDRFRQAESSSARSFGGLGLGLAIVRQLVELHGGSVHAESDGLGHGASFTVSLPAAPQRPVLEAAPEVEPGADRLSDLVGLRVLLVDDDADNREMLTLMLEGQGIEVAAAASAADGLAMLAGWRPDLLVSDIGMPQVDGYEFIRRARALEIAAGRPQTPAIALTAFAKAEDEIKALAAGFHRHLSKPVDPATLFATVSAARRAP